MSQGSWQVPTGGSESAITFAGQCNTAWQALASMNSGASAPANGPGNAPVQFQLWANTTNASFADITLFDGVNWDRIFTLDVAGSNVLPQLGGGQTTLASAANLDLGASRQTTIYISGSTPIATLGTSAKIGERKLLLFTGQATLTNSANIICPGGASIVANSGDACEVQYNGTNAWVVIDYQEGNVPVGGGVQTGDCVWNPYQGTRAGWVRCNGLTIGDGSSNATERANADTFNLFGFYWNSGSSDPEFAIFTSAGAASTRGASAAADWAAHKAIATVDLRGRGTWGVDGMGNSAAGRLTSTTASPNGTTQGATFGAQTVTLGTSNLPAYTPAGTVSVSLNDPGHTHPFTTGSPTGNAYTPTGASNIWFGAVPSNTSSATTGISVSSASFTGTAQGGSSAAVNKMPPGKAGTWFQKL